MKTVQVSPMRQLRAALAARRGDLIIASDNVGRRVGDWSKLGDGTKARLGMAVYDVADPRHEGEIIAIWNSARVQIRWKETGWKSLGREDGIKLRDLRAWPEDDFFEDSATIGEGE